MGFDEIHGHIYRYIFGQSESLLEIRLSFYLSDKMGKVLSYTYIEATYAPGKIHCAFLSC